MSGDQEAMEPCEAWHCFNLFLLPQRMDSNNRMICCYHITYVLQRESALYSWLNVRKLLARNRHDIWNLSDSNGIRTRNHLVRIVQATIECRFSLKRVRDMIITYSQVHLTDNYLTQVNDLASLAKWLSVCLLTKWLWVRIPLLSLKLQIWHLFRARSSLTFRQL